MKRFELRKITQLFSHYLSRIPQTKTLAFLKTSIFQTFLPTSPVEQWLHFRRAKEHDDVLLALFSKPDAHSPVGR
jgi:hypothetical protein